MALSSSTTYTTVVGSELFDMTVADAGNSPIQRKVKASDVKTYMSSGAGIGGTTGATDNALLRADGTAGATIQTSDWTLSDATGTLTAPSAGALAWSTDLFLVRDAANTLAQRNSTTAQVFRVYDTFTDASNYRRFYVTAGTEIGVQSLGTGPSGAFTLNNGSNGTTGGRVKLDTDGRVNFICGNVNRGYIDGGELAVTVPIKSSHATGGIGYATGAGGAVTQLTSRVTGVTVNKAAGAITLFSAAGSATAATFTVTCSAVAATDVVIVSQKSGTDLYTIHVTAVAAGTFNITFFTTGGTTTEQPVFNYAIIKAVAA